LLPADVRGHWLNKKKKKKTRQRKNPFCQQKNFLNKVDNVRLHKKITNRIKGK
jgi:hypothetical protein